jgi:hypothetical protein
LWSRRPKWKSRLYHVNRPIERWRRAQRWLPFAYDIQKVSQRYNSTQSPLRCRISFKRFTPYPTSRHLPKIVRLLLPVLLSPSHNFHRSQSRIPTATPHRGHPRAAAHQPRPGAWRSANCQPKVWLRGTSGRHIIHGAIIAHKSTRRRQPSGPRSYVIVERSPGSAGVFGNG